MKTNYHRKLNNQSLNNETKKTEKKMNIGKVLAESFENIPRETKDIDGEKRSPKETGQDMSKLLLESYKNIPRENSIIGKTKISPEETAVQNIEKIVELLKKRIKGDFGEQEEHSLEENAEAWKKDIKILRDYIEQEKK